MAKETIEGLKIIDNKITAIKSMLEMIQEHLKKESGRLYYYDYADCSYFVNHLMNYAEAFAYRFKLMSAKDIPFEEWYNHRFCDEQIKHILKDDNHGFNFKFVTGEPYGFKFVAKRQRKEQKMIDMVIYILKSGDTPIMADIIKQDILGLDKNIPYIIIRQYKPLLPENKHFFDNSFDVAFYIEENRNLGIDLEAKERA